MIKINLEKAKKITKDRLRIERAPLLQQLDVKFQMAIEKYQDTTDIAEEKQRLRDITNLVNDISTVEELKALTCKK